MFCKQCGKPIDDTAVFCPQCGAKVDNAVSNPEVSNMTNQTVNVEQPTVQPTQQVQQPNQQPINQPMQNPVAQSLGMNWYKFLIYFALFAAAVLNFSTALMHFTGEIHNMSSKTHVDPEWFYGFFPSLKGLDVFMGVIALVLCAGAILVRMNLAKFKKNGPLFYFMLIGVNIVTSIIYVIAYAVILSDATREITISGQNIVTIVGNIVLLILNIIYFNKRKHLFVNQ